MTSLERTEDPVRALVAQWKEEADTLEQRYGDGRTARMFRLHAAELEEAIRVSEDEILRLADAAREGGYSVDHLRHLVAEGKVRNAGTKGRPRVRRGDLPKKPGIKRDSPADEATRHAREITARLKRA